MQPSFTDKIFLFSSGVTTISKYRTPPFSSPGAQEADEVFAAMFLSLTKSFLIFSTLEDHLRKYIGERDDAIEFSDEDVKSVHKLAACILFTSQGVPMLQM